jgi:hypothetical protein
LECYFKPINILDYNKIQKCITYKILDQNSTNKITKNTTNNILLPFNINNLNITAINEITNITIRLSKIFNNQIVQS